MIIATLCLEKSKVLGIRLYQSNLGVLSQGERCINEFEYWQGANWKIKGNVFHTALPLSDYFDEATPDPRVNVEEQVIFELTIAQFMRESLPEGTNTHKGGHGRPLCVVERNSKYCGIQQGYG